MKLIVNAKRYLQIELSHPSLSFAVMIAFVYASCDGREMRMLWHDLTDVNINIHGWWLEISM